MESLKSFASYWVFYSLGIYVPNIPILSAGPTVSAILLYANPIILAIINDNIERNKKNKICIGFPMKS